MHGSAVMIYIRSKTVSRFRSIRFCLIHMATLTISQIAVKAISKNKNDISTINYILINPYLSLLKNLTHIGVIFMVLSVDDAIGHFVLSFAVLIEAIKIRRIVPH